MTTSGDDRAARGCSLFLAFACMCHPTRGSLERTRDALVRGDLSAVAEEVDETKECDEPRITDLRTLKLLPRARAPMCLAALASKLGGDGGFSAQDDASLGALGIWMLHAHHGEWVRDGDRWLAAMAGGIGPGADTLRLATATRMASEALSLRKAAHDKGADGAVPGAVARAIPGACEAYVARPDDTLDGIPATPCVALDINRSKRNGESTRGVGVSPTVQGAMAVWIAASRALDLGQDRMTGAARIALGQRMAIVRVARSELEERRALESRDDEHASPGAGNADGGRDGRGPAK